jgi:hypothetical protein
MVLGGVHFDCHCRDDGIDAHVLEVGYGRKTAGLIAIPARGDPACGVITPPWMSGGWIT